MAYSSGYYVRPGPRCKKPATRQSRTLLYCKSGVNIITRLSLRVPSSPYSRPALITGPELCMACLGRNSYFYIRYGASGAAGTVYYIPYRCKCAREMGAPYFGGPQPYNASGMGTLGPYNTSDIGPRDPRNASDLGDLGTPVPRTTRL